MAELLLQEFLVKPTCDMEGPEGSEFAGDVRVFAEDFMKCLVDTGHFLSCCGSFLQDPARMTDKPVIPVKLELNQFLFIQIGDIDLAVRRLAVADSEDSPGMLAGVARAVAFTCVRPVGDEYGPTWTGAKAYPHEPGIL